MNNNIIVFESMEKDEHVLINALQQRLEGEDIEGMIFFCSSRYDLGVLETLLSSMFPFRVVGCTTSGEIATHYQSNGFVAVCFSAEKFKIHAHLLRNLSEFSCLNAKEMAEKAEGELQYSDHLNHTDMFGFLLIDGLSMKEESVTAMLYEAFKSVPIIGGSAGDDLQFESTKVFFGGKFFSNAAVFLLIESKLAFEVFKLQHFVPSDKDMVVTEANPETRIVSEINGDLASVEYARIVGVDVDQLSEQVFAMFPVMLQIGDDWYVRSINRVDHKGNLVFSSAIDNGLPLTVAKGVNLVQTLSDKVDHLLHDFSHIDVTIGCDCLFRRLEIQAKGLQQDVESHLRKIKFVGFSSYGEQYNSLHVNQTLIGIIIGERNHRGASL